MSGLPRAWLALLRRSIAGMIQYRGEVALWAIWGVIYPAVALTMWNAAARDAEGGAIRGFGPSEFATYFLLSMIVQHLTAAWDVHEMGWQVRTGQLSPALLRPLLPMWGSLSDNIAYKLVTLVILAPIWVLVAWLVQPRFEGGWLDYAAAAAAVLLGAAIHYLWQYNLALIAFWSTRTNAVGEFWFGGKLLFGGLMAPLPLLPPLLQGVAAMLPFQWIIGFPIEVAMGRIRGVDVVAGLICQALWALAAVAVFRVAWPASLRRYGAVGV
ncbi:MAG: ABC-2 family transporter protein [Planctomycetia bacterium]|nr:MAG: ABC-2 family transporter protein [Planctomycetia bacterium]